jgi:hypothetical protein
MARKKSAPASAAVAEVAVETAEGTPALDAAGRYVGQWNRLVSTTNWEKGRIIHQWRQSLERAGEPASAITDEAWSQLVGGVTSQHVGRLRRVFQRFGDMREQFNGLFWSHFQAAIDWEDAEMWLEGAIQNEWSVSQMRGKRWETLGRPGDEPSSEDAAVAPEEIDGDAPFDETPSAGESASATAPLRTTADEVDDEAVDDERDEAGGSESSSSRESTPAPSKARSRLGVEVDDLPEDLADAFEQFKLAIIAQRRLGWSETTPESVLACLDALRDLTLAPGDA